MKKFSEEFAIVPRGAKITAICIFVGFAVMAVAMDQLGKAQLGPAELAALLVVGPALLSVWALLIGYVYADARRRGMRHVMWTLLALFIPNAIGIILYFLLREPLQKACPGCGASNKGAFAFCPTCGTALNPSCPGCKKAVERGWSTCAWCGQPLSAPERAQ